MISKRALLLSAGALVCLPGARPARAALPPNPATAGVGTHDGEHREFLSSYAGTMALAVAAAAGGCAWR